MKKIILLLAVLTISAAFTAASFILLTVMNTPELKD